MPFSHCNEMCCFFATYIGGKRGSRPAAQHRKSPRNRETAASDGDQNRAEGHRIPFHPLGPPSRPPAIRDKLLIAISESRHPLPKSATANKLILTALQRIKGSRHGPLRVISGHLFCNRPCPLYLAFFVCCGDGGVGGWRHRGWQLGL